MSSLVIIALIALSFIGLLGFFALYFARRRSEQAAEWWQACKQRLDLQGDSPDDVRGWLAPASRFRGTGSIEGRDFSIRQRHTSHDQGLYIEYIAHFDVTPPRIELIDHLDASDPVSLRVGIPRFDQKTIVQTAVPIRAIRTFHHEDLGATIHRIMHRDGSWSVSGSTLEIRPQFLHRSRDLALDPDSKESAAEELEQELKRAAEFCNRLDAAVDDTNDRRWRPQTKLASAWQTVADERNLDFACSETNYEDAVLEGQLEGRSLTAHTVGKGNRAPNRMELRLALPDKPYDIEFDLDARQGADSKRQQMLDAIAGGHHDLSTEDTDSGFDEIYDIGGDRIHAYGHLGRPGVEPALLQLYRSGLHVRIQSGELELTLDDPPDTAQALAALLDDLTLVADALEEEASDAEILARIGSVESADAGVSWNSSN